MDKGKLQKTAKNFKKQVARKSPIILTGFGIAGMYASVCSAVKATPKALAILDIHRQREDQGLEERLTNLEVVKLTWKCYIPTAIMLGLSTACLIGANTVNGKQKAVLATAYALSETALREYKDKVIEIVPEKVEKIKEAVAQEKINKQPKKDREVVITTKGDHLCFEPLSSRYLKTSVEELERCVNDLNMRMRSENSVSVNDWFDAIGLKEIDGSLGDEAGWNMDDGYIDISLTSAIADDGTPCLVITYNNPPKYGYYY